MFYFPRGGNRGGSDQFKWDDVKTDKHREFYLGHSVKAPVGRWQEGKDLTWYAKDKNDKQSTLKKEFDSVKNAEKEAMMIALGQIPPKTSNNESSTTKQCAYKPQDGHKLKESSESKQSSKKKKKKKKKERKERSNNYSSEEERKRSKEKKHNKHRHYNSSEDESKGKCNKKKNYSDHGETERLKHRTSRKYTQDSKRASRDVEDRHKEDSNYGIGKHYRKHHSDRRHKTLKRAITDSDESSPSEREFKKRKKNNRRK